MKRDNLPWQPVQPAVLRWNESGTPVSDTFEDVYYSQENGLEESRHVFLQGSDLQQRWRSHPRPHFCIGELGFGTGLNFLLTLQAWQELPAERPDLHYLAIEKHPLSIQDLARAIASWPALEALAEPLMDAYPGPLAGQHRILLEDGRVRLDLWWEDATQALPDLARREQPLVDAWYLDGFAPSRNSSMWTQAVLQAVAALSHAQASLATFTVAGQVRRDLTAAGFAVTKVPGYGRKRECLRGVLACRPPSSQCVELSHWDIPAHAQQRPSRVLVVGGGLAGCTTAAALARRGIAVTLLDRDVVAGAGSGNDQGILYTRLSRKHSALLDFSLQSFLYASCFYRHLFKRGLLVPQHDGELCGNFQQIGDSSELDSLRASLGGLEALAQVLSASEANELLGIAQHSAGYWYPRSGWLRPASVCRALLADDNIELLEHCGDITLHADGNQWSALAGGKVLASGAVAIVAAGTGTSALESCAWLPLQRIRGQVTQLPTQPEFASLRAALCHEGYIAPAREGYHCIGATFDINADDPTTLTSDDRANLATLATAVPAWRETLEALDPSKLQGRVGYRCASPDYLPLVGAAPDRAAFLGDFGYLRQNARKITTQRGRYLPGLYINAAHGSRGLTSTPIAAELLASMICGEPLPFSRSLSRALAPARFLIRDLMRNRIQ